MPSWKVSYILFVRLTFLYDLMKQLQHGCQQKLVNDFIMILLCFQHFQFCLSWPQKFDTWWANNYIITHCDAGYCGSFDHGFGTKGNEFHLGGAHGKLDLPHLVIHNAKGVLQDPDGIGLCTDITHLIGIMKCMVICEPINKYSIMLNTIWK